MKAVYHNKLYKIIDPNDIYYAEGSGSSAVIHLKNEKLVISNTLKAAESFFGLTRVHKCYSINMSKVKAINIAAEAIVLEDNRTVFYSRRFPVRELFESI